jgi:hypothetical protein
VLRTHLQFISTSIRVGAEHPPYAPAKRAEAAEKWLNSVRGPFQIALKALLG